MVPAPSRRLATSVIETLRLELSPMVRLAAPVVAAEVGWMAMGVVDTVMVGHFSASAIGAVGLGGVLYYTVAVIGMGMMLGLDTLVSQSFGAGDVADCHHSLLNSVYLSIPLSAALMAITWLWTPLLQRFVTDSQVLEQAIAYLRALAWGTLPLLLFFAFRRYLQGMNLVRPVMFTLISSNLINIAGNWTFVYGHLGAPALGAQGSGFATCVSRIYMAAVLFGYILYHDRRYSTGLSAGPLAPDLARIRRLVGLGLPAAMQMVFEVGVFAASTTLIGRMGPDSLAANQITMNLASFTYMVPLGIGSAAAVRVGHAIGRGDQAAASRAGWTAMLLGVIFMSCAAIVFVAAARPIIRIYTDDPGVLRVGVALLAVTAAFELFDGIQAVTTGALRGAGDTRTPMICHLIGYWGIGLPLGYWLGIRHNLGAVGLWIGLCVALIVIGSTLLVMWWRKVSSLSAY